MITTKQTRNAAHRGVWIALLLLAPLAPVWAAIEPIILHLRSNPDFAGRVTQQIGIFSQSVGAMSPSQIELPKFNPTGLPEEIADQRTAQNFAHQVLAWSADVQPQDAQSLAEVLPPHTMAEIAEVGRLLKENPKSKLAGSFRGFRTAGSIAKAGTTQEIEVALAKFWDHVLARVATPDAEAVVAPKATPAPALLPTGKKYRFGEEEVKDARERIAARTLMTPEELATYTADKSYVKKGMGPDGTMLETRGVVFPAGVYRPEYDAMLSAMGFQTWRIKNPDRTEIFGLDKAPRPEWYRWVGPADYPYDIWVHGLETRLEAKSSTGETIVLSPNGDKRRSVPGPVSRRRGNMIGQVAKSVDVAFRIGPLTLGLFDQWYELYEQHVVGKPGGERLVQRDRMRLEAERVRREKGVTEGSADPLSPGAKFNPLAGWWGGFFYDPLDAGKMIGGIIMREWPERNQLTGHFAAYADRESGLSERSFAEGMNLAHRLGYPIWSLGEDWNERGLGRPISLMSNKAAKGVLPVPDDNMELVGHLDMSPFGQIVDENGFHPGLLFYEIRTDTRAGIQLIRKYLSALEAGKFTTLGDVLGYDYFAINHPTAQDLMQVRRYSVDPEAKVVVPNGFKVVDTPLVK